MNKVSFNSNLVNALLQYLASRPYSEVVQMIGAMQQEIQDQQEPQSRPVPE